MAEEQKEKTIPCYPMVAWKYATIDDFLGMWQKIVPTNAKRYGSADFLKIQNDNKQTNLDIIWGTYNKEEQAKYKSDYQNGTLPFVKAGTTLYCPKDDTPLSLVKASKEGQFLKQGDFKAYWGDNYKKIISDPLYVPDRSLTMNLEGTGVNAKMFSMNVRVWVYIKALNKVIDLSSYVLQVVTTKTKEMGDFSIILSPFYFNGSSIKFGDSHVEQFNTLSNEGAQVKDYMEKFIQVNDIVFVRFERLMVEAEKNAVNGINMDIEIPISKVAKDNVWDMIGFVDTCSVNFQGGSNLRTVSIEGRDIHKLFSDDGCYFIPLLNIQDDFAHWYDEGGEESIWFKRNIITGQFSNLLWTYEFKKIRECIWFIINTMSNLGVVKNSVFDSWEDKRTKSYDLGVKEKQSVNGIWQIVKVFIDEKIDSRVLIENEIGNPNGTLMDYMGRVCQSPLVEFYFDTYVNTIDIVVRQPPFNQEAIMGAFKGEQYVTIKTDNVLDYSLSYDNRVYSWYQLRVLNNIVGQNNTTNLAFVPIVYFNEYAELYGNKKLVITDQYLFLKETEGVDKTTSLTNFQAAALNDLIYIIESSVYLPFTRTGTITLNGDRRIKVGTFVLLETTNEFFYVTSVMNSVSFAGGELQRQTIIQVERGMYVPILSNTFGKVKERQDNSGQENKGVSPSYFKLVDLTEMKRASKKAESGQISTLLMPKIDKQQFDYFVNRKMYGQ